MSNDNFEQKIKKYADLLVKVGLNVKPGQRIMISASITGDPVVRRLTHYAVTAAYQAGARYVKVRWLDSELTKIRLQNAPADSFEELDDWYFDARETITKEGGGILFIYGEDPDLLAGQDQEKIATMQRAGGQRFRPIMLLSDQGYGAWSLAAVPEESWADKMFPDLPKEKRIPQLWDYIFETCRINEDDPIAAWQTHSDNLIARANYLTEKGYTALHFSAPGTDLTVGMPENHIWLGGGDKNNQDIWYMPNIPTEEAFSMPHKDRTNGTARASKPLSYAGTLIENFSFTFKDGKVIEYQAEKGYDALKNLMEMDEGSSRIGEVALAPNSSPIAKTGRLFYETLYDENAANHIAFGNPYRNNLKDGPQMSDEDFAAAGGNNSLAHVDFMIGSGEMDVDGISADGSREPIMRKGEWAFVV